VLAAVVVDVRGPADWCLCEQLRSCPDTARTPLIVVTGYVAPDARFRRLAAQLGCAAFLSKPSLPSTVVEVVARVIDGERGIEVAGLPPPQ
jgi:CheY-like chemotaxis protein